LTAANRLSWAEDPANSLGRLYRESQSTTRTPFARDRDRIIHSTAFRRLKEKTQVFVAHEGDYYRTRLTHSLEVAQIARSIANALGLDDDLAETVALAHDLGHPPFGHAGEDVLSECMKRYGGFDHNVQTFRVVTELEHRYPVFAGLNLTWETLEGVIKHNGPVLKHMSEPAWSAVVAYNERQDLRLSTWASAEAQVAALADDIAYNNHDPGIDDRMLRLEAVRRMIGVMVGDVIAQTRLTADAAGVASPEDVRMLGGKMVSFSPDVLEDLGRLSAFLYAKMYRNYRVNRSRSVAKRMIGELFNLFMIEPDVLPGEWSEEAGAMEDGRRARIVCDYIAGMTDRFAIEEHRKLFRMDV
jgi:dGTPase